MLCKNKLCWFTPQRVPEFISMFTVLRQFLLLSTISALDSRVTKLHTRHTLLKNVRVLVNRIPDIKNNRVSKTGMPDKFLLRVPETIFVFPTFPLFALDYHFGVRQSSHKITSHDIHYFNFKTEYRIFLAYTKRK